jgi:hypothetical protein
VPPDTQQVFLHSNVCLRGEDFGPDYGGPVVVLPVVDATQLVKQGKARLPNLGPCTRTGVRCDAALPPSMETPRCCIEGALETLRAFRDLCAAHDVTWWMDYGTLLGAAMNGRFYWNDKDCDIGILAEDQSKVLRMQPLFEDAGFDFLYQPPGGGTYGGGDYAKVRWSGTHHANTDAFFWHERDGVFHRATYLPVDRYKGREFSRRWLFPLTTLEFEGMNLPAPREWELMVEHRYGAGWKDLPAARHDGVVR